MAGFPLFSCVTREGAVTRDDVVDPGRAEVLNEGTRSLTAKAEGPGWLVTPIPWYPGWSATIDGQAAAIEVLDGALVGVQLAEGEHTVEFTYWPAGLNLGIGITLASLAAAGALWYSERRGMKWTRFGLEASNGIVADEADNDRQQEDPEHDDRKSATAE
jgi:hypothetical protein